jgi:hypothetical protein
VRTDRAGADEQAAWWVAGAARGAASFVTGTISRVRHSGATGQLAVRADSAFYSKTMLAMATKFDVRSSITARQDKRSAPGH